MDITEYISLRKYFKHTERTRGIKLKLGVCPTHGHASVLFYHTELMDWTCLHPEADNYLPGDEVSPDPNPHADFRFILEVCLKIDGDYIPN